MDSILSRLEDQAVWEEFLAHRLMKCRFTWSSFDFADEYVATEGYLPAARKLLQEGPGIPEHLSVNKMGSGKKRIVYHFGDDETRVLKLLAHLLYRYDEAFAPNCYAFRRGRTASDAVFDLRRQLRGKRMWAYKLDIHDYFHSISIPLLLPRLKALLADDPALYAFFERLLSDDRALEKGSVVHESRGVMAGTPTAPFLADVYLMEVDRHFHEAGVIYARYSDDILLFAPDRDTLEAYKNTLLDFLRQYKLEVNPSKEHTYSPDEPYEFLGFQCIGESIDIARATREKMKGKIRRAAHALRRWQQRKGCSPEYAMKGLIRHFNNKFFENGDPDALSWSRWFFPVINRTEGLREIDRYLQQYIRYLSSGRHTKANYRVRYRRLKALGYRSLVHAFYKGRI